MTFLLSGNENPPVFIQPINRGWPKDPTQPQDVVILAQLEKKFPGILVSTSLQNRNPLDLVLPLFRNHPPFVICRKRQSNKERNLVKSPTLESKHLRIPQERVVVLDIGQRVQM